MRSLRMIKTHNVIATFIHLFILARRISLTSSKAVSGYWR